MKGEAIIVDERNALSLFEQILVNNVTVLDFGNRKELVARDLSKRTSPQVHTYRRGKKASINEYIYRLGENSSLEKNFSERYSFETGPHIRIDRWMREAGI